MLAVAAARTLDAHAACLSEASALIWYLPPYKEASLFDRRRYDARLKIVLRLSEERMRRWNEALAGLLGRALPPLTIELARVEFSPTADASTRVGTPTWPQFIAGNFAAPAAGFTLAIGASEDGAFL